MNWQKGTPQMGEHRGSAKMMELEARIKKLEEVLELTAGGTAVKLSAQTKLEISAPVVEISGPALIDLKGSMVKLANGTKPVARLGDTIAGGPGTGSIVTGCPIVLVP